MRRYQPAETWELRQKKARVYEDLLAIRRKDLARHENALKEARESGSTEAYLAALEKVTAIRADIKRIATQWRAVTTTKRERRNLA